MPLLTLQLFGQPRVCVNGQPVKFHGARAAAVLYYCLTVGQPVADEVLINLLWPGEGQSAAKKLTEVISHLNRALQLMASHAESTEAYRVCVRANGAVAFRWEPNAYQYDVAQFIELVHTACSTTTQFPELPILQQAQGLYERGPFLGTFSLQGASASFDDWIAATRSTLHDLYLQLLQPLSVCALAQGDWHVAVQYLQQLQQEAPQEDVLYGLLMVSYAASGNMPQVEKTYQRYVKMLQEAPPKAPNAAMLLLYQGIRDGLGKRFTSKTTAERILQIKDRLMPAPLHTVFPEVCAMMREKRTPTLSAAYHQVMQYAYDEAVRQGSAFLGTSQLLLALCAVSPEPMSHALVRLGRPVRLETVVQTLRSVLGEPPVSSQAIPEYTLTLQRVLQKAQDFAIEEEINTVEASHLWRALLQEEPSLFSQVLERYSIDRQGVIEEMERARV